MKSKNKHDHRITNFLKVFIFMLVMLAPFFAIGVKCWYVANNPNAVQSYRGNYSFTSNVRLSQIISSNATTTEEVLVNENTYYKYTNIDFNNEFNMNELSGEAGSTFSNMLTGMPAENVSINDELYTNIKFILYYRINTTRTFKYYDINFNNSYYIKYQNNNGNIYDENGNNITPIKVDNKYGPNDIKYKISYYNNTNTIYGVETTMNDIINKYFYTDLFIIDTTLSSVFYSAVQELDDASIFSWTTKTAIYSGLLAMSEGLGVDTPPLAVLLTYWTIITSIYIIIDIILEMFIFLTHWLNDKIC